MSWLPDIDPACDEREACSALELVIIPRAHDLGGFQVRRALPATQRQMVGPFIFFDQMGPADFDLGRGIDVRPHPHIGLATLTWLFDGEIVHKDSLGSDLAIRPGAVNWMTAGRGIVHSERTGPEERAAGPHLFGIQSWVALPHDAEEVEPGFAHHGAEELPTIEDTGVRCTLIAGSLFGQRSPVRTHSDLFYADVALERGARVPLPAEHAERAVHVAAGRVRVAQDTFEAGQLLVFRPGDEITLTAETDGTRLMLLGGEPMDGPRHIWWNFVSSSRERIEDAKADWIARRFDLVPGDEEEFIPLPE